MLTASSNSFPRMSLDKANYDKIINLVSISKQECHFKFGKLSRVIQKRTSFRKTIYEKLSRVKEKKYKENYAFCFVVK